MANENKLQDIIKTSLESIRSMVDANTVIGNPINTESGTTIIPPPPPKKPFINPIKIPPIILIIFLVFLFFKFLI